MAAGAFGSLDTALNVAFPDLVADFGLSVGQLQWVVVCFVLVSGGLLLPAGAVGDAVGHDSTALAGAVLSTVAMVACALAPGFGWFLAARVVQGVGTAAVMASAPALATQARADGRRDLAVARFQTSSAAGLAAGPVIGGLMVLLLGWRGVFWFRVPLAIGLVVLALRAGAASRPRAHAGPGSQSGSRWAAVDGRGSVLVTLLVASVLATLSLRSLGPVVVAVSAVVALLALAAFVAHGLATTDPIIDPRLFTGVDLVAAATATLVVNGAMFATWLLLPSLLVDRMGRSVLVVGLVLAVSPLATALASSRAGLMTGRRSSSTVALVGLSVLIAGMAVLATAGGATTVVVVLLGLSLVGAGLGLFSVPNMALVMGALPADRQGVGGALSLMMRTLGIVLGVTIQGELFDRIEADSGFDTAYRSVFGLSVVVLFVGLLLVGAASTVGVGARRRPR